MFDDADQCAQLCLTCDSFLRVFRRAGTRTLFLWGTTATLVLASAGLWHLHVAARPSCTLPRPAQPTTDMRMLATRYAETADALAAAPVPEGVRRWRDAEAAEVRVAGAIAERAQTVGVGAAFAAGLPVAAALEDTINAASAEAEAACPGITSWGR